jgi:hypothetical protein
MTKITKADAKEYLEKIAELEGREVNVTGEYINSLFTMLAMSLTTIVESKTYEDGINDAIKVVEDTDFYNLSIKEYSELLLLKLKSNLSNKENENN